MSHSADAAPSAGVSASTKPLTVIVIASGGGHWVQLRRMRPAWEGCRAIYLTTQEGYREETLSDALHASGPAPEFHVIPDANRWQKLRLVKQLLSIAWIMTRARPDAVISTGAAPGYFAIRLGRLLGARTIWVDSIANAQELSLSGRKAGRHAHLWLTQWEHLAAPDGAASAARGPRYRGSVI